MKRLTTGLILIILVICSLFGCRQPVGSLDLNGNGGSGNAVDDFFIQVFKANYYLTRPVHERTFLRRSDFFRVVGFGSIGKIDQNDPDLLIEILSSPVSMNYDVYEVIEPNGSFEFSIEGNYILRGTYKGITDEVPIEVFGSEPNTGEGSSGIGWVWL